MRLLEDTERSAVEKLVYEDLEFKGDAFKVWFQDRVTNEDYRRDLGMRITAWDQIKHAMTLALEEEGRRYPGALLDILNDLAALHVAVAAIRDKVVERMAAVAAPPTAPGNYLTDLLLYNRFPFVNRGLLRSKLGRLLGASGTPLFIVNGEQGSGKSYTLHLLEHCWERGRGFRLVPIQPPLLPEAGPEMMPELLAEEIIYQMGLQPDTQSMPVWASSVSLSQYGRRMATWTLGHIKPEDTNVYWIVLDGFGCEELNERTQNFLSALAAKITAGIYRQKVKLILLNYPPEKLSAVEDYYDEEIIKVITVGDLKTYLRWWYDSKEEGYSEEDLTQTINSLVTAPSPEGEAFAELKDDDDEPLNPKQLKKVSKGLRGMA